MTAETVVAAPLFDLEERRRNAGPTDDSPGPVFWVGQVFRHAAPSSVISPSVTCCVAPAFRHTTASTDVSLRSTF